MPLLVLSFGLFDVSRASIAKQQLQDALDDPAQAAPRAPPRWERALPGRPARPGCCDTRHRAPGNERRMLRLAAEAKRWMSVTAPL